MVLYFSHGLVTFHLDFDNDQDVPRLVRSGQVVFYPLIYEHTQLRIKSVNSDAGGRDVVITVII